MHIPLWLLSAVPVAFPVLCSAKAVVNDVTRDLKAAYYVNLDAMPTRRMHMEEQLKHVGLHAKRWSAVDWRRVAKGEFDREYLKPQGLVADLLEKPLKESNGTVGCYLSHLTALMSASKELRPNDLALIMEDDVSIPDDWRFKMQKALELAPPDWQLLKLSGWGSARVKDVMNRSDYEDLEVQSLANGMTTTPRPTTWNKFTKPFSSMFKKNDNGNVTYFLMREPFTEPAGWGWGAMGWGTPNFFYSGTGAYLVRGSSIQKVIQHLRRRPINDLDAMLLSDGTMRFYEGWPHVFDLGGDAFHGPGLHGRKSVDEFDNGYKNVAEPLDETPTALTSSKRPAHTLSPDGGGNVQLAVMGRGMAVAARRAKKARESVERGPELSPLDDKSIVRSAIVKPHDATQAARAASLTYQDPALRSATKAALAEDASSKDKDYGHPKWLRSCAMIYLDVGSNIGVQVRKLFEPERYPGAPALKLFDATFGVVQDRQLPSTATGLCALGLEPNPAHRAHLQQLQENYTAKGWNVHFYPFAAWKDEGKLMFDEATQPDTESWGAKLTATKLTGAKAKDQVSVRTVSLADFIRTLPRHSVKLMKVDIEGAEYETVWRMLQRRVLCQGVVDAAFFESHAWGDVSDWKDNRTYAALVKHINGAECGMGGKPTAVMALDDETYRQDTAEEWPSMQGVTPPGLAHRRNMYFFLISASALVLFGIGVRKYSGESHREKVRLASLGK